MFSPDCICVCSFSTTSPSPMRSWVTLMPVISENALASVLDSYSWVVMVSDTTLMSMPWNGSAALMNHSISAICSSLLSEEGWNSLSTHRSAASMSAWAVPALATMASAAAVVNRYLLMPNPPLAFCCRHAMRRGVPHLPKNPSHETEYQNRIDQREREGAPEDGADQPQPRQMDEGAAEQRQEQPVAARGLEAQQADAWRAARPQHLPDGHGDQQQEEHREEQRGRPGPGHPGEIEAREPWQQSRAVHRRLLDAAKGEALGDVVAHEVDHQRAGNDGQHASGGQHAPVEPGGGDGARHGRRDRLGGGGGERAGDQQLDPGEHEAEERSEEHTSELQSLMRNSYA